MKYKIHSSQSISDFDDFLEVISSSSEKDFFAKVFLLSIFDFMCNGINNVKFPRVFQLAKNI